MKSAPVRIQEDAARRLSTLQRGLARSRCPVDAALLITRLSLLPRTGEPPMGGAAYLTLCRELRALRRALLFAELKRTEGERLARAELAEFLAYLLRLRPGLAAPLRLLFSELPLDQGAARRLQVLRALLEARQVILPHLAAARSRWKR